MRDYDGSTDCDGTGIEIEFDGLYNDDDVSIKAVDGTYSYSDASAGTDKEITLSCTSYELEGEKAGNYYLTDDPPESLAASVGTISKAALTAVSADIATRAFQEENTTAEVTGVEFTGLVNGETLALGTDYSVSGEFDSADAGENKSVSVTVTLADTAKANNYSLTSNTVTATGTVTRASREDIHITGNPSGTITYGDTFTLSAGDGVSWSASGATVDNQGNVTITKAGEVIITAVKPENNNYYAVEDKITFTAVPKPLTVSGAAATPKLYDGTKNITIYKVDLQGVQGKDEVSVQRNFIGELASADVGSYDYVTLPQLSLSGADMDNYTLIQPVGPVFAYGAVISKADYPGLKTAGTSGRYGAEKTYDMANLLPEGYVLGTPTASGDIFEGAPSVEGSMLKYKLADVESNVKKTGTITVPVTEAKNYKAFDLTITVSVTDKYVPTLSVEPITVTYSGAAVPDTAIKGTATAEGNPVTGTWSFEAGQTLTNVNDSGPKNVVFTPDDGQYAAATGTVQVHVLPAPIAGAQVVLSQTAFKYDGTAHKPAIASVKLGETTLTAGTDYAADIPEGTDAGEYTVTFTGKGNYTGTAVAKFTVNPTETSKEFESNDGRTMRLEIETGLSTVPDGLKNEEKYNTPEKIENELRANVGQVMSNLGEQIAVFDVTLQYRDDSGTWKNVEPNNFPAEGVTAVLPYPAGTGASGYTFTVQHLVSSGAGAGTIETLDYQTTSDGLQCRFTSLSPVAIGYKKNSSSGGSGGGGWYPSASYYDVKVENAEHGTVTASPTSASSGSTVTLTVKPDDGYKLDKITVTDSQGKAAELTEKGGKYTFKMPARSVTVKAEFAPAQAATPSPSPSDSPSPSPSMSPSPKPWKNPFPDVKDAGWYIEAIEFVSVNGLMTGYSNGKFGPNDNLSRAQFAQILYNKEGRPVTGESRFSDVKDGMWYACAVSWAAEKGVVSGVGGGRFAPDRPITRQDLAVMLWRYAGSPEPAGAELNFKDADKVSGYARKALCWATENGVVSGKPGKVLDPKGAAKRSEVAQMLMNYLKK